MQPDALLTGDGIFSDVSDTIRQALIDVRTANPDKTMISSTALTIALEKLLNKDKINA
jgi:Arc/MetJ-type ribon-helix-helix transcriptional regulator